MVERSKEYEPNNECNVCSICQNGVFRHYRGRELKNFLLPPLACSESAAFSMNNAINL